MVKKKDKLLFVSLPNISEKDRQEDGNGVRAVRLAGGRKITLTLTALVLVLLVVVQSEDDGDGRDESNEPQEEVSLAVGADVAEGAAVEGVDLDNGNGGAVQEGLVLLVAAVAVVGAVVGHGGWTME